MLKVKLPGVHLVSVKSKEGDVFRPPTIHLGQPMANRWPRGAAKLALAYLVSLVDEAEKLVSPA